MPTSDTTSSPTSPIEFNTCSVGTSLSLNFDLYQNVVESGGLDGPWHRSLGNFRLVSARAHRALLLDRILDAELPRYAEALKRLGEWTT
jgi:hypothetical protein